MQSRNPEGCNISSNRVPNANVGKSNNFSKCNRHNLPLFCEYFFFRLCFRANVEKLKIVGPHKGRNFEKSRLHLLLENKWSVFETRHASGVTVIYTTRGIFD